MYIMYMPMGDAYMQTDTYSMYWTFSVPTVREQFI